MTRAQATKHSRDGSNVHSHLNETIPQKKKSSYTQAVDFKDQRG